MLLYLLLFFAEFLISLLNKKVLYEPKLDICKVIKETSANINWNKCTKIKNSCNK